MKVIHYNNTMSYKDFKVQARSDDPDLVHIHDCWSLKAWRVMLWCRRRMKPVVLSPDRQLMPWHVRHYYWLNKLPRLLLFQKRMVKDAHAVVAVTEQEQQHLLTMGILPQTRNTEAWNDRVVFIPDHRFTNELSEDDMNERYDMLYQKVLDSHSFMVMSADDHQAENTLLRLGLSQDAESQAITEEDDRRVQQLSADSWRKILLHADEEGILQEIRKGAALLKLAPQSIVGIERFPLRGKKDTRQLPTDKALMKPLRLKEYSLEKNASAADVELCRVVLNFIHEMNAGTLSRRHVADLYTALRFTEYNETRITQILQILKEKKTAQRLLCILHETLGLEEGFMPMEMRNDRGTRKISRLLFKLNIQ